MCTLIQAERKMRKDVNNHVNHVYSHYYIFLWILSIFFTCFRCQYLIDEKFQGVGTLSDNCIFLCDDDNDIELATSCCFAFLPSLTSDSIKQIAHTYPERIIVATDIMEGGNQGTTRATETLLQTVFYRFFSNIDGSSVSDLSRQY
jgi:hypothetical protein